MIRFKLRNLDDVRNPPTGQVRIVPDENELFWQISADGTRVPFGTGVSNVSNVYTYPQIPVVTDPTQIPPPGNDQYNIYVYNDILYYTDSDGTSAPVGGVLEVSTFVVDGGDATTDFSLPDYLKIDFGASA